MEKKTFMALSLFSVLLFAFISLQGNASEDNIYDSTPEIKKIRTCKTGKTLFKCDSIEGTKREFFCSKNKKLSPKKIAKKCLKAKRRKVRS